VTVEVVLKILDTGTCGVFGAERCSASRDEIFAGFLTYIGMAIIWQADFLGSRIVPEKKYSWLVDFVKARNYKPGNFKCDGPNIAPWASRATKSIVFERCLCD
jgi:hypothetical protein